MSYNFAYMYLFACIFIKFQTMTGFSKCRKSNYYNLNNNVCQASIIKTKNSKRGPESDKIYVSRTGIVGRI